MPLLWQDIDVETYIPWINYLGAEVPWINNNGEVVLWRAVTSWGAIATAANGTWQIVDVSQGAGWTILNTDSDFPAGPANF
jgi:hypothetical protein